MKKVFITGITGFIGQNLSRGFLKKGWLVYGVDNLSVGNKDWLDPMVIFKQGDISSIDSKFDLRGFDLIIHLASMKIPRYASGMNGFLENTFATLNMFDMAQKAEVKLLYLSSSEVYGKNTNFAESSDSIIGNPIFHRWSYAISKMWGEQLLNLTTELFDFNIVRLFGTYGPYHALSWTAGPQSVFISQALKKEPLTIHGDGYQIRAFQYVDDAVNGIMRVAESNCSREIFNIGNPYEPISIILLAQKIWNIQNPDEPMKWEHTKQSSSEYEEIQSRIPDITKAKRLLEFDPKVDLDEGLKRTIEWQRGVIY